MTIGIGILRLMMGVAAVATAFRLGSRLGMRRPAALYAGSVFALSSAYATTLSNLGAQAAATCLPIGFLCAEAIAISSPRAARTPATILALLVTAALSIAPAEGWQLALFSVLYALLRRARGTVSILLALALLLLVLIPLRFPLPPGPLPIPPAPVLLFQLFPHLRPGRLEPMPQGFLGLVALSLSATALVVLPGRRTLALLRIALLALLLALVRGGIPVPGIPATSLLPFALCVALLAGHGLASLIEGIEPRASAFRRNSLALLTAICGGLSFHVITVYLRGGERPADAPTLLLGICLALGSLAAALCPILAMLRGAWNERRRALAIAIAACSILELLAVLVLS